MSKFLKFIVNLFLICAILVAAAIIVPPLAGVGTTIVDTQLMDTNLPMGSVTYSADVYITELAAGDRIIDEDDVSAYVYTITSIDTSTGAVTVRDSFDAAQEEKNIQILNSEAKVILTIPYIGYVVYAMHSIEGIIILALVVLLIIILFILSELWRKDDDDEDEDEDDYDDDDEAPVRIPETEALELQNEVDITPYIGSETAEEETAAEPEIENVVPVTEEPAERMEVPEMQEVPETEPAGDVYVTPENVTIPEALPQEEPAQEEQRSPEEAAEEIITVPWEAAAAAVPEDIPQTAEAADTAAEVISEAPSEVVVSQEELPQAENPQEEIIREEAAPAQASAEEEPAGIDMDFLEKELEAALTRETAPAEAAEAPAEKTPEYEPEDAAETAAEAVEEAVPAEVMEYAEKIVDAAPEKETYDAERYLEAVTEEEQTVQLADDFVPVARPGMEEIMKTAERAGKTPEVIKEPITGLSYVDYSDLL